MHVPHLRAKAEHCAARVLQVGVDAANEFAAVLWLIAQLQTHRDCQQPSGLDRSVQFPVLMKLTFSLVGQLYMGGYSSQICQACLVLHDETNCSLSLEIARSILRR